MCFEALQFKAGEVLASLRTVFLRSQSVCLSGFWCCLCQLAFEYIRVEVGKEGKMSGTGPRWGRGHMNDRFSDPRTCRVQRPWSNGGLKGKREPENRNGSEEKCRSWTSSASSSSSSLSSPSVAAAKPVYRNLDRFLEYTTPFIPAQFLPKTSIKGWRTSEVESLPFYTLDDLWDSFKEWSAYGAGVPLVLNGSDSVIQYYVPYLSAIQLYAVSHKTTIHKRHYGIESDASDGDLYRDTSSETSSDSEAERGPGCIRNLQWRNHQTLEAHTMFDRLTLGDQSRGSQEGFSSDESEVGSSPGRLVFQYFERALPISREPLADKVADLARNCPELKTLRSIDLLPASWMSVAWYPIYRIPTGPTLRDLDACFLTFHPLATPLKDGGSNQFGNEGQAVFGTFVTSSVKSPKISLPVFGLSSYKFRGPTWTSNGSSERQQAHSLLQSAEKWLRSHCVEHPDFEFFVSRSSYHRR